VDIGKGCSICHTNLIKSALPNLPIVIPVTIFAVVAIGLPFEGATGKTLSQGGARLS
jgi:hypothetical protein